MAAGEPRQPDDNKRGQRQRATVAAWCQAAGALLAIVAVVFAGLNVITAQQTIALGLPAVLLIVGGVIAASTVDRSTAEQLGFRTGLHVGKLLRWLRSLFGPG
jgi:hypothetical protein